MASLPPSAMSFLQRNNKLGAIPYFRATYETLMPDERDSSTAFNFSPKAPAPAALDSGDDFNAIKTRSTMHSIRHTPISYHQCIRVRFNWGLVQVAITHQADRAQRILLEVGCYKGKILDDLGGG